MIRKLLSLVLCTSMLVCVVGCTDIDRQVELAKMRQDAESDSDYESNDDTSEYWDGQDDSEYVEEYEDDELEPQENDSNQYNSVDINFQNIEFTIKDDDGYEYKVRMKISPWILQSNSDAINSAWNEVGNGNVLPTIYDFELDEESKDRMRGTFSETPTNMFYATVTDMYYAVGQVEIENITDGWSFTDDKTGGEVIRYLWNPGVKPEIVSVTHVVSKTYYNGESTTEGGLFKVSPHMDSDRWGPVSFVIAHAENFSPDCPEGEYRDELENGVFTCYGMKTPSPESAQQITIPLYDHDDNSDDDEGP